MSELFKIIKKEFSSEGKPTPSLTWWRESVLLDDSYEVSPEGVVRNEIEITSLQRHDLMAVFTCQASNNNLTVPVSKYVTVDMNNKSTSQQKFNHAHQIHPTSFLQTFSTTRIYPPTSRAVQQSVCSITSRMPLGRKEQ
ncbi:ig-like domain-containing protein [Trichonephila clavata]|uniref:Ig-like domain-containing protein n=1 Tax=Trichonephila clavata TaxID=2740835 RepID=A0A8X6ICW6_TRICU|nr:ig-like domain-containing protein [Trichonephila clavata]